MILTVMQLMTWADPLLVSALTLKENIFYFDWKLYLCEVSFDWDHGLVLSRGEGIEMT